MSDYDEDSYYFPPVRKSNPTPRTDKAERLVYQKPAHAGDILRTLCRQLETELENCKQWIRDEGQRTDTCTFNILKEICENCRCKRHPNYPHFK